MHLDVLELKEFYASSLGQVARRMIRRRIREFWPDTRGLAVLGLGYATPYLRPFLEEAGRTLAIMPAEQGVERWPTEGPSVVALAEEGRIPLPDASVDYLLIVHGVESTNDPTALLGEAWRVLAATGRLLVVVPNRSGLWARADHTAFGHGRPYSQSQLHRQLKQVSFVPERSDRALYVAPSRRRFLLRTAPAWENVGRRWLQRFAGVILVEATKQVYARANVGRARRARPVLVPIGRPVAHPQPTAGRASARGWDADDVS